MPEGQHIIGFKGRPDEDFEAILNLEFLLADTEKKAISGSISFPPLVEYPDREKFETLYLTSPPDEGIFGDFQLSKISFSQFEDYQSSNKF